MTDKIWWTPSWDYALRMVMWVGWPEDCLVRRTGRVKFLNRETDGFSLRSPETGKILTEEEVRQLRPGVLETPFEIGFGGQGERPGDTTMRLQRRVGGELRVQIFDDYYVNDGSQIALNREQAEKLRDWLTAYLGDAPSPPKKHTFNIGRLKRVRSLAVECDKGGVLHLRIVYEGGGKIVKLHGDDARGFLATLNRWVNPRRRQDLPCDFWWSDDILEAAYLQSWLGWDTPIQDMFVNGVQIFAIQKPDGELLREEELDRLKPGWRRGTSEFTAGGGKVGEVVLRVLNLGKQVQITVVDGAQEHTITLNEEQTTAFIDYVRNLQS